MPDADELGREAHDRALARALVHVKTKKIRGRAVTPALIKHMTRSTKGRTTRANVALLADNARVAGELAVALTAE